MKCLVHSKETLKFLHFVKSFKSLCALFSKIPLMIGCTIGVEILYPVVRMFFDKVIKSSFNFSFVSRIEKCFSTTMEAMPFSITTFTCCFSSPLGMSHSYKDFIFNFSYGH